MIHLKRSWPLPGCHKLTIRVSKQDDCFIFPRIKKIGYQYVVQLAFFSQDSWKNSCFSIQPHYMYRNFILTAWRAVMRDQAFSLINIFGLAVGITSAFLIFLWVEHEIRFDRVNKKRNSLYSVVNTWLQIRRR